MYQSPRKELAVSSGFFQYSWNRPAGRCGLTRIAISPSWPGGSTVPVWASIMATSKPGAGPPGRDHLRIEGLAGPHTVAQFRQVVALQVFQHHHAIGRGRGTEGRNAMLFQETQSFLGIKTDGAVLDEHRGAHTPGAEEVAIRRLGPAGIREVPMQVRRLEIEPVLAR